MYVVVVPAFIVLAVLCGVAIGWLLGRHAGRIESAGKREELEATFDRALDLVRYERSESMQAALDGVLSVASSKLGDQLTAGRMVIERERDTVSVQVDNVNNELRRVAGLVHELQKERAAQSGHFDSKLTQAMEVTASLSETTRTLQQALASPQARGQWGERMAEDVLRSAGFIEGVNYHKQRMLGSGGIPDYTFPLPQGHIVHMDVKFPIDNYLRWLEAENDHERSRQAKSFQRDVRQRIKELADRSYIDAETTVDYLLLFIPNESVYGFVHEHDPGLLDDAMAQKVVLCSPTTLFAVLAVIRQAVDNFRFERRSSEILGAVGALREQWDRWSEPMEKMRRGLFSAQKAFDDLAGPRTRQFERQLEKLEVVRDDRIELDDSAQVDSAHDGVAHDDSGLGGVTVAEEEDEVGEAPPTVLRRAV